MATLKPVDYDPFSQSGPTLTPVDNDPFATESAPASMKLTPVEHDPFAEQGFVDNAKNLATTGITALNRGMLSTGQMVNATRARALMDAEQLARQQQADEANPTLRDVPVQQNLPATLDTGSYAEADRRRLAEAKPYDTTVKNRTTPEEYAARVKANLLDLAKREVEIKKFPPPKIMEEMSKVESFSDFWKVFKKAPATIITSVGFESGPLSLAIAGAGAAGSATGMPFAGPALTGAASYAAEYTNSITDALREEGVDFSDAAAVEKAFADDKLMERVEKRASARALPVAAMDAATFGLASKLLIPGRVAERLATRPVARELTNLVPQTAAQAAGGAIGEAGAELASGQPLSPSQIGLEAVGEMVTTPVDVAAAAMARGERPVGDFERVLKELDGKPAPTAAGGLPTPEGLVPAQDIPPPPPAPPVAAPGSGYEAMYGEPATQPAASATQTEAVATQPSAVSTVIEELAKREGGKPSPLGKGLSEIVAEQKGGQAAVDRVAGNVTSVPVGEPVKIITPDSSAEIDAQPVLVELDTLKPASGKLQPRDRSRVEMVQEAKERAVRLDPARLMPDRVSDAGAPIVTADGTVISGNGRVLSIAEVYSNPALKAKAAEYKAALPAEAQGMNKPVLVMQSQLSGLDAERFAQQSNRPRIATLSATEQATTDASVMGDILDLYQGGDFESAPNAPFLKAFATNVVASSERNSFSKDGQLSAEGMRRMQGAILARAYGESNLLSRMLESTDDNVRAIVGALQDAAPQMAALRKAVQAGQIMEGLDPLADINAAVTLISDMRKRRLSPAKFFRQMDAFTEINPDVAGWVLSLYNPADPKTNTDAGEHALSRPQMAAVFRAFANEAMQHKTGGFFDDETTRADILSAVGRNAAQGAALAEASGAGPSDGSGGAGAGQAPAGGGSPQAALGDAQTAASAGAQQGQIDQQQRAAAKKRLRLGLTYEVPLDTVYAVHEAISHDIGMIPSDVRVGVVEKIEPVPGGKVGEEMVKVYLRLTTGQLGTRTYLREFVLKSGAVYDPDVRALFFIRYGDSPKGGAVRAAFDKRIRGEVRHELLHLLRTSGVITGAEWNNLVSHARNKLRVLTFTVASFAQLTGKPVTETTSQKRLDRAYEELYSANGISDEEMQERLDQEAVTHALELAYHGKLNAKEIAPLQGLIDKMELRMYGRGAQPGKSKVMASLQAQDDLSPLGFYSTAIRAANGLKQAKGTAEQMLAQLKSAGVKDSEIKATGLDRFLSDRKSVTKDEIVSHLAAHAVEVREVEYGGGYLTRFRTQELAVQSLRVGANFPGRIEVRPVSDETVELVGIRRPAGLLRKADEEYLGMVAKFGDEYVAFGKDQAGDQRTESAPAGPARWTDYALDGSNPTYSETVLHLPTKDEDMYRRMNEMPREASVEQFIVNNPRQDFRSGHWSEPNVIAHVRSSLQKDSAGNNVFLIDEAQSDWGQKVRDKGERDEAKIASLRKRAEEARAVFEKTKAEEDAAGAAGGEFDQVPFGYDRAFGPKTQEAYSKMTLLVSELATAEAATPAHPLVSTTDQWLQTTLRRILMKAVEAGADAVSFTPGRVQAERYGLGGHVDEIIWTVTDDGGELYGRKDGKNVFYKDRLTEAALPEYIGKSVAEKLLAATPDMEYGGLRKISGVDLEVGGEGMRATYDKIYPQTLAKILGKLDKSAKPDMRKLFTVTGNKRPLTDKGGKEIEFITFPLTEEIKGKVSGGMPLFSLTPTSRRRSVEDILIEEAKQSPLWPSWGNEHPVRAMYSVREQEARKAWDSVVQPIMYPNGIRAMERWEAEAQAMKTHADLGMAYQDAKLAWKKHELGRDLKPSELAWEGLDQLPGLPPASDEEVTRSVLGAYDPRPDRLKGVKEIAGPSRSNRPQLIDRSADDAETDGGGPLASLSPTSPLDMSPEARKARAEALGFDTSRVWYHGTAQEFSEFSPSGDGALGPGVYLTADQSEAASWARARSRGEGGSVKSLYTRGKFATVTQQDGYYGATKGREQDRWLQTTADMQRDGFDGVLDGGTLVVFSSSNIRSTSAAFDPAEGGSSRLLASLAPTSAPSLDPDAAGPLRKARDSALEFLQDAQVRVRRLVERADEPLPDAADPYMAMTLYHGRLGGRAEEAVAKAEEILKGANAIAKATNSPLENVKRLIDLYLVAKHAPERNAVHGDGSAGITNAEATAALARVSALPQGAEIISVAGLVQAMNRRTLQTLLDGRVISQETFDLLSTTYANHVPLNRILPEGDEEIGAILSGGGFDVRGTGLQRARGSKLPIAPILENVLLNHQQAILRAEKNTVDLASLAFVRRFEDDLKGQITILGGPKPARTIDAAERGIRDQITALKKMLPKDDRPHHMERMPSKAINDPRVLELREDGERVLIRFRDPKLAAAFKATNSEKMPRLLYPAMLYTRVMSQLATRFNPEFAPPNKIRDIQETAIYIAAQKELGAKGAGKFLLRELKGENYKAILDWMMGRDTPGARLYQEMIDEGGTTGGLALSSRDRVKESLAEIETVLTANPGNIRKALKTVAKGFDHLNKVFEDSTRLSAYRMAKARGLTKKRAAVHAKEASINFNRMGTAGPVINGLWMFSNASIQGTTKMIRAMKNPKVATTVVLGMAAAVAAVGEWNDQWDEKWREKVTKWDRLNSLVVVLPSSTPDQFNYFVIPVSWGLKPILNLTNYAYDAEQGIDWQWGDFLNDMTVATLEAANPLGGTSLTQALVPTALDMPVDLKSNVSWSGSKIKPDPQRDVPEDVRYFSSLSDKASGRASIAATEALVDATGIAVSPADVNYVFEQLVGGVGRTAGRFWTAGSAVVNGEVPDKDQFPFLARFYRRREGEEIGAGGQGRGAETREVRKLVEGQGRERVRRKYQLEGIFEEIKSLPKDEIKKRIAAEVKKDPAALEVFKGLLEAEAKGLTGLDKQINLLGVENGERASYYFNRLREASPEERRSIVEDGVKKGLISRGVIEQIGTLNQLERLSPEQRRKVRDLATENGLRLPPE